MFQMDMEAAICTDENSNEGKMKRNNNLMVYLKIFKLYAFDSLNGTELKLKVSLNAILSVFPGCHSMTMM